LNSLLLSCATQAEYAVDVHESPYTSDLAALSFSGQDALWAVSRYLLTPRVSSFTFIALPTDSPTVFRNITHFLSLHADTIISVSLSFSTVAVPGEQVDILYMCRC
jgi:hypothetical protein